MKTELRKDTEVVDELPNVRDLLPIERFNLETEEGFVQAGQVLIEIGRKAFIALGELLAWKVHREGATDPEGLTAVIQRYAAAWGTSRSSLMKAYVNVARFEEIERPQDTTPTQTYEILSGAEDPQDAEAGFDTMLSEGWGVREIREAKMLRSLGLTEGWEVPYLFYRDGMLWGRMGGREFWVAYMNPRRRKLVQAAVAVFRRRCGV